MLEISQIFLKVYTRQMFGYPGLDAGLNTPLFGGDIAFSVDEIGRGLPSLVFATSSQVIKPLNTSFQFYNLFCTIKTCEMNAKSSII